MQVITKIKKAAAEGDKTAEFLLEQVDNFNKALPTWQENTVREYALWNATSHKGYEHVTVRKLLGLPCPSMLQKFVRSSTGETRATSQIREHCQVERHSLLRKRAILQPHRERNVDAAESD